MMMMSDKRRPVIGKLVTRGLGTGFEACASPTSPLEYRGVLSPTGVIDPDMGGIGLGIVAALENISVIKTKFRCENSMRSDPIPVGRSRNVGDRDAEMGDEVGSFEEEYTIVTCRKPDKSFTKVYHGGRKGIENRGEASIFNISPARFGDDDMKVCQPSGFLSSCHLCNKRLHGKDIYMYRGEKAFCSPECRSRQITMDDRPEKRCSSQATSNGTSRQMFTGIFAI